jgi:hypothetical protein
LNSFADGDTIRASKVTETHGKERPMKDLCRHVARFALVAGFVLTPLTLACNNKVDVSEPGGTVGSPAVSENDTTDETAPTAPPAPEAEAEGAPPSPHDVWVHGMWRYMGGHYHWYRGRWEPTREGFRLIQGHWAEEGGHWVRHPCRWARGR